MAKVIIFGNGRGANVATRYFAADSPHEIVAYTVDDQYLTAEIFMGKPVVPFSKVAGLFPPNEYRMFIPLGFGKMNKVRADKFYEAKGKGYELVSYISSKVSAYELPLVGENCFILENNVFNFDVKIGNNVTIWSSNHIGDLCIIENHVWISSQVVLSGEVTIGEYSFIAINATLSNYVKVAPKSYIGANTLIVGDTEEKGVYVVEGTKKTFNDSIKFLQMIRK